MKALSCLIIDDNPFFIRILEEFIANSALFNKSKCANSLQEAESLKESVDVVFYDPEVVAEDPEEVYEHMEGNPQLVLISSNEEFAMKAMDLFVTDFLDKSLLTTERFSQTEKLIGTKLRTLISA